jgi:hypothetical protein
VVKETGTRRRGIKGAVEGYRLQGVGNTKNQQEKRDTGGKRKGTEMSYGKGYR